MKIRKLEQKKKKKKKKMKIRKQPCMNIKRSHKEALQIS